MTELKELKFYPETEPEKKGKIEYQEKEYEGMSDIDILGEIEDIFDEESGHPNAGVLPKNIRWENLYNESQQDDVGRKRLVEILTEIKQGVRAVRTREEEHFYTDNFSEEEFEEVKEAFAEIIKDIKEGLYEKIGEGTSANVFMHPDCSAFCFKIIKAESIDDQDINSVREEAEYLDKIVKLNIGGSRSPKPYYTLIDHKTETHYLVMEKLKAMTLPEFRAKGLELPLDFDVEKAFNDLEELIRSINEKYEIDQNDMRDDNIMINFEEKSFQLIDFGRAQKRKEEYRHSKISKDMMNFEKIKINFLNYIKNK